MRAADSPASLWGRVLQHAGQRPGQHAVAGPESCYTWSELAQRARAIAGVMQRTRIQPGERVCLSLPSGPEWVAALLAARQLGLIAVSIGDRARPAELQALSERFDVGLVLGGETGSLRLDAVAGRRRRRSGSEPRDGALIHLTSGSSGVPKGVLRTEADLLEEAASVAAALRLGADGAVLCATPVFHSFASGLLGACLYSGTPCLLMDRLAPATLLELARRHGASIIAGVPYVFQTLNALSGGEPLPSLRLGVSGGAHLGAETARRFRERFGAPLVQEYGLSEAGIVSLNLEGPPDSVGTPLASVSLRIADPADPARDLAPGDIGEVIVRRNHPPAGYIDNPQETASTFTPHGIRSGDLGSLDASGRLRLTGRMKEMINVAGAKVAPREVEAVLLGHPAVADAAVFGLPHATLGEAVAAVVASSAAVSEASLRAHCRGRLSAHKIPISIRCLPELPRTASGKPDLPRIRRQFDPGGCLEGT